MFNSGGTLGGATLSPVRPVLATADNQWQTITIWDHAQGQIVRVFSDASPNNYHVAGFSQAGRLYAAVQGIMWRGLLYDLAQAQPLSSVRYTFTTQEPDWAAGGLLVTGDERFLVSTGDYNHPGRARIWDTASGTLVRTLPSHESAIWTLAIDNRNKRIATAGYDVPRTTLTGPDGGIAIKVWDQESGALLQSFVGHTDMVVEVAFSPDGRQLLSGGKDGRVRLVDRGRQRLRDFAGPTDRLTSRTWYGLGVSFSPNGRLLASAGNDSSVRDGSTVVNVWSTETGSLVRHLQVRGDGEPATSPTGRRTARPSSGPDPEASTSGASTTWTAPRRRPDAAALTPTSVQQSARKGKPRTREDPRNVWTARPDRCGWRAPIGGSCAPLPADGQGAGQLVSTVLQRRIEGQRRRTDRATLSVAGAGGIRSKDELVVLVSNRLSRLRISDSAGRARRAIAASVHDAR